MQVDQEKKAIYDKYNLFLDEQSREEHIERQLAFIGFKVGTRKTIPKMSSRRTRTSMASPSR